MPPCIMQAQEEREVRVGKSGNAAVTYLFHFHSDFRIEEEARQFEPDASVGSKPTGVKDTAKRVDQITRSSEDHAAQR